MTRSFVHTHNHSEYSLLDGASKIDAIVQSAVDDGQPAIGITDHGNMYGVVPFYKACKSAGINPLLGIELYQALDNVDERLKRKGKVDDAGGSDDTGHKMYYHLITLAETTQGYHNLLKLSSDAFLKGYYQKARVDWEMLDKYHEGIIATTGCLGGQVLQALMKDNYDLALSKAGRLQDIFGKDNLFVELQDHGIAEQLRTNPGLIKISKALDAPLLLTNDCHYVHRTDHKSHDALLCAQTGSLLSDEKRFKFEGEEHYLKTAAEMRMLFSDHPEACDNTLWIAERCNVEIEFHNDLLPKFPVPDGYADDNEYLHFLMLEGAKERWGTITTAISDRLEYEFSVISQMGFSSYFLILWDLVLFANSQNIRTGPGRGSAAGCAIAYCLGITKIDPIKYDLIFERFLNPSRVSLPDVDLDIDSRYRDTLISYSSAKYGSDHVAQTITFASIKARSAIRDAARVLGHPYFTGDQIAKAIPEPVMGRDTPLYACMEVTKGHEQGYVAAEKLRSLYEYDDNAHEIIDVALGLEGLKRSDGIHASAVVISNEPITNHMPVQRKNPAGTNPEDTPIVSQYDMNATEELGFLKMDFLGLRNLDCITDTIDLLKAKGIDLDIESIALDDEEVYMMLQRGDSTGVFQLESKQMRALMRSLLPICIEDLAALVALYRPGPMATNMHYEYCDRKNGRREASTLHSDADDLLATTYSLMIYQESMLRIAQKFAGYSLAEADILRKACGKKIRELIAAERGKFVDGCVASGYERSLGTAWFDVIEPFGDYSFNYSHAMSYAYIAYQTAYLKIHYPAEYFAALLTSVKSKLDKAGPYLIEARNLGLTISIPDINKSDVDFYPDNGEIVFGLSAIHGVGDSVSPLIVNERKDNGPFKNFQNFCERVDLIVLNSSTIEALIKAGCFDSLGHTRKGLLSVYETMIKRSRKDKKKPATLSLFDSLEFNEQIAVPTEEFSDSERLLFEKEMVGVYISGHPLTGVSAVLSEQTSHSIDDMVDLPNDTAVLLGGVVSSLTKRTTKKGDPMATFVLDDLTGSVPVVVFPKSMKKIGHLLTEDAIILVKGRTDQREELQLILNDAQIFVG